MPGTHCTCRAWIDIATRDGLLMTGSLSAVAASAPDSGAASEPPQELRLARMPVQASEPPIAVPQPMKLRLLTWSLIPLLRGLANPARIIGRQGETGNPSKAGRREDDPPSSLRGRPFERSLADASARWCTVGCQPCRGGSLGRSAAVIHAIHPRARVIAVLACSAVLVAIVAAQRGAPGSQPAAAWLLLHLESDPGCGPTSSATR